MDKQSASQSQNDSVVSKPLSYSAGQSGSYPSLERPLYQ